MNLDRFAEQAVIGALLLEPERYADVREWLEAADFDGLAERQAYEAMQSLATNGDDITPAGVNRELSDGERGPTSADAPFLVSCMQACPVAARAAVYGRMVLETSIRRRVTSEATGLRQRAERATTSTELNRVFAGVDAVRRRVERLHERETKADRSFSPTPLNADDLVPLRRSPGPNDAVVERSAVLSLVDQPLALGRVSRWLERTDFSDPECSVVFGELQVMLGEGKPIDALTVAWRASRSGMSGPVVEALLDVQLKPTQPRPDATRAARLVLEQSVRGAVIDTTHALEESVQNVGATHDPTGEAYARLNSLWPNQRRLIRAGMSSA